MSMTKEGNPFLERWDDISADVRSRLPFLRREIPVAERTEAVRERIERVSSSPREQEVLDQIFKDNPELHPDDLHSMCKECDFDGISFLEYQHGPYPNTSYIYVSARCQKPTYLGAGRRKEPLEHPSGNVLLKRGVSGKFRVVYRWDEEEIR